MCGRVAQYKGAREYADSFTDWPFLNFVGEAPLKRYNVAPSTRAMVLCREEEALCARLVKWGWQPRWWTKDDKDRINARVEKVASSDFYQDIWLHRAICPLDGWFEWVDEGGPKKQPYYIRRRDGMPCLSAAIGHFTCDARDATSREGFVIITADSLGGIVDIHDCRPVVFSPEMARAWLDPDSPKEHAEQIALQRGESAEAFEWYKVSPDVESPKSQGPHLIEPMD